MAIRFRRAKVSDLSRPWPEGRIDRALLGNMTRSRVVPVLEHLMTTGRLCLCSFDDCDSGSLLMMGGFGCLPTSFISSARNRTGCSVLEQAFESEALSRAIFMNRRQVAAAQAASALELFNVMLVSANRGAPFSEEAAAVNAAFRFFVDGYRASCLWHESGVASVNAMLIAAGWTEVKTFERAPGESIILSRMERKNPAWPLSGITLNPSTPICCLTFKEQELLEFALSDYTDRELATELSVSLDAVKKRWRSIHLKMTRCKSDIFCADASATARRRAIIRYMRRSMHELRPFQP